MSLIFQSMSSTVNGTSSAGKTSDNGKSSASDAFGQTLVQQLLNVGSAENANTSMKDASVLFGASVQMLKDLTVLTPNGTTAPQQNDVLSLTTEQDDAIDLGQMLMSLLSDLNKLEEALQKDPSLLQELQVWLMQAGSMINGVLPQGGQGEEQQQVQDGEVQSNVSPLASHPDTVRFAVQDVLTQLSNMVKSNSLGDQAKPQLLQLAQSFQSLLTEHGSGSSKGAVLGSAESGTAVMNQQDGDVPPVSVDRKELPISIKPVSQSTTTSEVKGNMTSQQMEATATEEVAGKADSISEQNPLTAGQLALRAGTTTPVKPMAQPVPVEQFAKEMNNLIVNKLEFVKLHGFTEARISLNPEHLGQVDIKISMQNGLLVAQFMTRNSDARELLDQQMSQLRSALQGQGLQVEKIEVTQSSQSSSSQLYQDGRQSGSGQQDSNRRSREKDIPSDDAVTAAAITEEWNEWLAEREGIKEDPHSGSFTASV